MRVEIPGYKVLREIGRGGMSIVYLAIQENLDRQVALKVMHHRITGDQEFKTRFQREGKSVAQLTHLNIVNIFDMGITGDHYYIAMEYIPNGNLKGLINDRSVTLKRQIEIIKDIAAALRYAHQKGCIHRDVKPMNILFREDGSAVLTDFGVAKMTHQASATLTSTGFIIGTPRYMCPEQAKGDKVDNRSDIYSLGVVFFELLSGRTPYDSDSAISVLYKHVESPIPALPAYLSQYQPIIHRLLAKNPTDRYQNIDEFLIDLDVPIKTPIRISESKTLLRPLDIGQTRVINPGRLHPATHQPRSSGKKRRLPALLTVVLLASIGGIYLYQQYFVLGLHNEGITILKDGDTPLSIANLLNTADQQFANAKLIAPPDDNAYQTFKKVLTQQPNNSNATRGLKKIERKLIAQIKNHQEKNQTASALQLANKGLNFFPNQPAMLRLQRSLTSNQPNPLAKSQFAAQDIESLLETADNYLKKFHLTTPRNNNAYDIYQAILKRDPDNTVAAQGMQRIADTYLALAQSAKNRNDLTRAVSLIELGLKVSPRHMGLDEFQNEIINNIANNAEQENKSAVKTKISQLLTQAKAFEAASQLTKPANQNAAEIYQQILSSDQDNDQARRGLHKIADHQVLLANKAMNKNNLELALDFVNEGLTFLPSHQALNRLKSNIISQITGFRQTQNEKKKQRITNQLRYAATLFAQNKLLIPETDNALLAYQKVLKIDKKNKKAQRGINKIRKKLIDEAEVAMAQQDFSESEKILNAALKHFADDTQIKNLKQVVINVTQAQTISNHSAKQKTNNIEQYLKKAHHQFSDNNFTQPVGNNAYESYQQVLKLDPNNQQALLGLKKIADEHLLLAQQAKDQGKIEKSLQLINTGLSINPWHKKLEHLKFEVTLAQEEKNRKKNSLQTPNKAQFTDGNM